MNLILRIDKLKLFFLVIGFILFPPIFLEMQTHFNVYFLKPFQIVLLCVLFLIEGRDFEIGIFEGLIFIFVVWGGVVNFANGGIYILTYINTVCFQIVEMIILGRAVSKCGEEAMEGLVTYFAIIIWANAFTMLLYPGGIIRSTMGGSYSRAFWLLGSKNVIVQMMPIYIFSLIYKLGKKVNLIDYLTILIGIVSLSSMGAEGVKLLSGSSTCIIEFAICILCVFYKNTLGVRKIFGTFGFFTSAIFTLFITVILAFTSNLTFVNSLLKFLGKDGTFSGRIFAWTQAVSLIKKRLLLGYGNDLFYFRVLHIEVPTTYSNWLGIILRYGLIGVLIFLVLIFWSDYRNKLGLDCINIRLSFLLLMVSGLMYELNWKCIFFFISFGKYWYDKKAKDIV